MIIVVHVSPAIADDSHRATQEEVDVEINDTIDTVKVKITLLYTELNPDEFYLQCSGRKCEEKETVLDLKKRYQQ